MSTPYVGSGIVKDGLVFHFDQYSKKTWRGAPTTNLYATQAGVANLNTFDSWELPGVPGGSSNITTDYGTWHGSSIWKVSVGTGTLQLYAAWRLCLNTPLLAIGTTRRLTAKVKMLKGDITDLGYHNGGGTYTTTYTALDPSEVPGGVSDNTGWYKLDLSVNWTSTYEWQCVGIGILSEDIQFLIAEPGVLTGHSFDPGYTPNSRDNTEVLYDATGKNTITANTLTYDSDRTFSFNGTNDDFCSITAGTELSAIRGTSNISVESWVYYTSYSGGGESYSVLTTWGSPWVWLLENPSNILRFRISAGSSDTSIADTATHPLNTWLHVVGTYDGSTKSIYVNGVLKNSSAQTGVLASPGGTPKIGTYQGTNYNFFGEIGSVRVYNRALTAVEVEQNFDAGRPFYGI